jgi:pyruvyltransferase
MLTPIKRVLKRILFAKYTHAFWYKDGSNWGDALNPVLIEYLSGRPARFASGRGTDKYLVVGSILSQADGHSEVWGAGFIRKDETVVERPRAIHAVRGPLSHARLLSQGIDAPSVFGDPALLLPQFFDPDIARRYDIGIVPHYEDMKHPWVDRLRADPAVCVIDVEGGVFDFVKEIKSCEVILSSSLHGLICAEAYGVPSLWIELSDKVIGAGFKFRDYFASLNREVDSPVRPSLDTPLSRIVTKVDKYRTSIDLRRLMLSCPFLKRALRSKLEREGS